MVTVITLLIKLYRANPLRPHCDSKNDVHTTLCNTIMPVVSALVPNLNTSWDTGDKCLRSSGIPLSCGEKGSGNPYRHGW